MRVERRNSQLLALARYLSMYVVQRRRNRCLRLWCNGVRLVSGHFLRMVKWGWGSVKVRAFPGVTTVTSQKLSSAHSGLMTFLYLFGILGFQQQALHLCGCGLSLPSCVAWLTGAEQPPPLSYSLLSSLSFLCSLGEGRCYLPFSGE